MPPMKARPQRACARAQLAAERSLAQVGGMRVLRIPAALAYGARGAGCRAGECIIPPDASLTFTVTLSGLK